ncbi:MAG: hypothetical protein GY788_01065 [bacterium]|nr:hypothetical protein [bacterium]
MDNESEEFDPAAAIDIEEVVRSERERYHRFFDDLHARVTVSLNGGLQALGRLDEATEEECGGLLERLAPECNPGEIVEVQRYLARRNEQDSHEASVGSVLLSAELKTHGLT